MTYASDFSGTGKHSSSQVFHVFSFWSQIHDEKYYVFDTRCRRVTDARFQWNEQVVKRPWNVDCEFDSFHENDCLFKMAHVGAVCHHQCTFDLFFSLTRRNRFPSAFT